MPRHNGNAQWRGPVANGRWSAAELKAMSNYVDHKEMQARNRNYSTIKTTPEQIVRDHRNSVADLVRTPSVQRIYKAPWYRAINWNRIVNWGCWAALIACLVYLGIFFFWAFAVRIEWK